MVVPFERFGLQEYELFLRTKKIPEQRVTFDEAAGAWMVEAPARYAELLGVARPVPAGRRREFPAFMWDYQKDVTWSALEAKRYAVWADCGLGKTLMFLEWALHVIERTGGRVLILSPLQIIGQTIEQARAFYGQDYPIRQLHTRAELVHWCSTGTAGEGAGPTSPIAICNYEKLIDGTIDEMRLLAGIVCDESSILKTGGGVIKWNVIKSSRGVEYKLSCTATPAPNDVMEYASQAAFLETIRHEGEVLWTWFTRGKDGEWYIKPHAKEAFFRFMASWSIYLRDPAAYGWKDNVEPLPEPIVIEREIEPTDEQARAAHKMSVELTGDMFASERMGITVRTKMNQMAKGFVYGDNGPKGQKGPKIKRIKSLKPKIVAGIVEEEVAAGRAVLVWTVYDEEAEILREWIGDDAEYLSGKTPMGERQAIIERFRSGETKVLVGKASMLGYGLNFHHVGAMVFSGWNDSFEQWYQAIRRAYRYGQTQRLRVHVPFIAMLEGKMLENVMAKQSRFIEETRIQEINYLKAMADFKKAA